MKVPYSPVGDTRPVSTALRGPSGRGGTPEAFGAEIGGALGNAAGAADQVGDFFEQKYEAAQRFATTRALSDFETNLNDSVYKRSQTFDPSTGVSFTNDINELSSTAKENFLKTVPPALQDEFSARANEITNSAHASAVKFQITAMGDFAKQGINDQYDQAKISLDQDSSPKNLDAQRLRLTTMIDEAPLNVAEKIALKRQVYAGIEAVSYKTEVRKGLLTADAIGVGSPAGAGAFHLIQQITGANPEDAKHTANVAESIAKTQVDPQIWADLSDPVKAGLISVTAQQGGLPQSVLDALASGGDVAAAVEALGGDKHKLEASVMRGDALLPQSQIEVDPRYSNIPYEDRVSLRADAEREATADANKAAAAQKARDSMVVNNLLVGLNDGTSGQEDIDMLRQAGILTDYEEIKKAQGILDKKTATLQLQSQGIQMIQTGQTFNPSDPDHVKIENALVGDEGMAALNAQDSNYVENILVPVVRSMKDVPPDVAGLLTGMVRSDDPKKATWALDTLSQLQQASPEGYDARTNSTVASDVELWRNGKDYYPQDKLLEILHGGDSQEMRVRTEALKKEAKDLLVPTATRNIAGDVPQLMGITGPNLFGQGAVTLQSMPQASQGLLSDFNDLFVTEYARSGNASQAKQTAITLLKRDWGVTSVGGQSTLMKFPPEKVGYTPINDTYDWMTQQGAEDLQLQPGERFQLVADDQTRAEFQNWKAGGAGPSYKAVIMGTDGNWRLFTPEPVEGPAGEPVMPGSRLAFDMRPFIQQQAEEWVNKRSDLIQSDAMRGLGNSIQMSKATGAPIPDQVLIDYGNALDTGTSYDLGKQ